MYYIIELQTNNGQTAHLVSTASTRLEAESRYHQVLAAAAISNVEKHACAIITEEGFPLMHECYKHEVVASE